MIDILIPLGKGSRHTDIELRYCLRSIEKHLSGVGNIWIIGEMPEWLRNVVHVPCQDNPNNWNRARNIYLKIMVGINHVRRDMLVYECEDNDPTEPDSMLPNNFLFMNDDHFLLKDYEAAEFPFYHRGEIETVGMTKNMPQWRQYKNTTNVIGVHALDYDVHCPILYNKTIFKSVFTDLHWPEHGYAIKSMYCNKTRIAGELCEDLKFSQPAMCETIYRVLDGRGWFSIGDRTLRSGDMLEVLGELYPDKSKWEL
ncbi:MAG: hypothetical protein V4560_14705 [Bacteroidota bacterium]